MSENNNITNGEGGLPRKQDGFELPEGYFDAFSTRLFHRLGQESELSEFKLLSAIPKIQVFQVPEHYFNQLECKTELLPMRELTALKKQQEELMPAPEAYFEQVESKVRQRLVLREELKAFKKLGALEKTQPFVVDDHYFDTLDIRVKERLFARRESVWDRVLDFIFSRKLAYSFSMVLLLGLSLWFMFYRNNPGTAPCNTLACVEKQELLNSSYMGDIDEETLIDMVNDKNLADTLNLKQNSKGLNKQEFDYILDNVDADKLMDEL